MLKIPLSKPIIDSKEVEAVARVIRSGWITMGPKVEEFEEAFARFIGVKHAIAVNSGTVALQLIMKSLGVEGGDEIIVPSLICMAVPYAVLQAGATPVFADVDPRTFNLNPHSVEEHVSERTKAIVAVHLYGQPAQLDQLEDICKEKEVSLVEDCAQAPGARYQGRNVGSFGDASFFSFGATKNMTTGEGGMILTNDRDLNAACRSMRYHDVCAETRYVGSNYKMTDIQAAMGLVQLKKLHTFNMRRRRNAELLSEHLRDVEEVETPFESPNTLHVYHRYTITLPRHLRERLRKDLLRRGVGCGVLWDPPAHLHQIFKGDKRKKLPTTEYVCKKILSLPVHPSLSPQDIEYIAKSVKECLKARPS